MASLFDRLNNEGRQQEPAPPPEKMTRQPRRREDPKIFLKDILANGPAPVNLIIERGAERGFSKRQITYAREQMKLIALKGLGMDGRWFWVLPHDSRSVPAQLAMPNTTHGARRGRPRGSFKKTKATENKGGLKIDWPNDDPIRSSSLTDERPTI